MMRFLSAFVSGFCLLLCSPAHATSINFSPGLGIFLLAFADPTLPDPPFVFDPLGFELANLSIVRSEASATSTGSGTASASLAGWRSNGNQAFIGGNISASLGSGTGSAAASFLNISTFDLLFPKPGQYVLDSLFAVNGDINVEGPNDSSFADWDLLLESPNVDFGFSGQFGESQNHVCVNGVGSCGGFFDASPGLSFVNIGDDLRIPFTATIRFEIGVSRAVAVPEPGVLILLLGALIWLGYRKSDSRQALQMVHRM